MKRKTEKFLQRKFDKMYVTKIFMLFTINCLRYAGRNKWQNCLMNEEIQYEDVFTDAVCKVQTDRKNEHKNIKHLVIDEMQDYSIAVSYLEGTV